MSAFPNPRYDPSRRRRHRSAPAHHHNSPLTTIATAAAVAYGAYQLGSWAWNSYFTDNNNNNGEDAEEEEENNGCEDLLYEWIGDVRTVERDIRKEEGFEVSDGESFGSEESNKDGTGDDADGNENDGRLRRSRRSRVDWGDGQKPRSRRPSPPHRNIRDGHSKIVEENHTENSSNANDNNGGMMGRGMKGAAAVATAGIGIGGAVSAGISAGIQAYNQNNISGDNNGNSISEQERRLRMGRCRLETSRAMDFLPTLKKAIAKETDVSAETEGLKRLRTKKKEMKELEAANAKEEEDVIREEERQLWNVVKNKSVTRLVATVYAHTIVFLVLTVQVNLLGARLLRDEEQKGEPQSTINNTPTSTVSDGYRKSHQMVLSKTYHYLFSKGIPSLTKSIGKEVERILQIWDVVSGDSVSFRNISTWMNDVRNEMEQQQNAEGGTSSHLAQFVIPSEEGNGNTDNINATEDELAKYILDETYDLLESPTFANAERHCLNTTFDHLRTKVFGKLFLMDDQIPLANIVTQFQKTAVSTFHKPPSHKEEMQSWGGVLGMMEEPLPSVPNDYISKLERLDAVQELSDVCF